MDAAASQTLLQRILAMKVTKKILSEIIDEEINLMIENGELDEGFLDRMKARASGVGTKVKGYARQKVQQGLGGIADMAGEEEMGKSMRQKAAATKAGAYDKSKAQKTLSILNSHLKNLTNDLQKLGIDLEGSEAKEALHGLKRAVAGSIKSQAEG